MALKKEHDNVLCLRKTSCDSQWESIKSKFIHFNKIQDNAASVKSLVQNKVGITRRIQGSDKSLSELQLDGTELITNVRVANDKREIDRRIEERNIRSALLKDLDSESIEAEAKFMVLKKRWVELNGFKDPMGLYEGLEYQKKKIAELMDQKNEVIKKLHDALDASNQRYYADQEKQDGDIGCLIERIDCQVEVMKRAYRQHLELLQKTIDEERDFFKDSESEKWQNLYDTREQYEQRNMTRKKEQSVEYNLEIKKISLEHEELSRATKIRLERDNDALQVNVENVKAEIMLNSEKLSYNHQILQKRSDENVIVKSQQKKRLNKLNALIADLKNKIKIVAESGENEISKLTADVMKLYTNILEMEAKASAFGVVNDKKYHTVWEINEKELAHLVNQILSIDKVIFNQQLGIEWSKPGNLLLHKNMLVSYNDAKTLERIGNAEGITNAGLPYLRKKSAQQSCDSPNKIAMLKIISQKISGNTSWLIDNNLPPLADRSPAERSLVKLDNVFAALGVYDVTSIAELEKYFLPYIWCQNCSSSYSSEIDHEKSECNNHYFVIESASILTAIREYIRKSYQQCIQENGSSISYLGSTISRLMNADDVSHFWKAYTEMFPKIKEKTWVALEAGLVQYLQMLKRREKLDAECSFLRNQNEELEHLLKMYIPEP